MSALPVIEPIVEPAPRTRTQPSTRTLPRLPEPIIIELPRKKIHRGRVKKSQPNKRVATIFGQVASFAIITGFAFGAISLGGQVMVEKARRDDIRATERARQSSREITELRGEVQDLSSTQSIDNWAAANGFIPAGSATQATGVKQVATTNN